MNQPEVRLRAGVATQDITPAIGGPLAGFAMRANTPSTAVAAPLRLRVLVLEAEDGAQACIASAELLNWPREAQAHHRCLVAAAAGIDPDAVLLTATHNHSGPQPNTTCLPSLGQVDRQYLRDFEQALRRATDCAVSALSDAVMFRSTATHPLALQRRAGDPAVGTDLTSIILRNPQGQPLAVLTHYACHPVVSSELVICGDYPGFACAALERRLGVPALFLQGFAGDVNPGPFTTQGAAAAERVGNTLADAVVRSLEQSTRVPVRGLEVAVREVDLPVVDDLLDRATSTAIRDEWLATRDATTTADNLRLRAVCLRLSETFGLLAVNGEVSADYAQWLTQQVDPTLIAVGYAGGMTGYLPTAAQIDAGGYEPIDSALYYGLPGRVAPSSDPLIRATLSSVATGKGQR